MATAALWPHRASRRLYWLAHVNRDFELELMSPSCVQHRTVTSGGVESNTSVVHFAGGSRSYRGGQLDMLVGLKTTKVPE